MTEVRGYGRYSQNRHHPYKHQTGCDHCKHSLTGATVAVGRRETFSVEIRNSQGVAVSDAVVDWRVADADKQAVRIVNQQGTQVRGRISPKKSYSHSQARVSSDDDAIREFIDPDCQRPLSHWFCTLENSH